MRASPCSPAHGSANLVVGVIDNERYGETGMQETHTARGVDLEGIARASGFRRTATVYTMRELEAALPLFYKKKGPVFINVKDGSFKKSNQMLGGSVVVSF